MSSPPRFAPGSTSPTQSRPRATHSSPTQGPFATPARPGASSAAHQPDPSTSTAGAASLLTSSPHYTTSLRSRHSLYGTEDRVVLDLGSRIWKVGFSGEPQPRECRSVVSELAHERAGRRAGPSIGARGDDDEEDCFWALEKAEPSEEEWLIREERVKRLLRKIWFENLMIDPKTRKVIVVENPLLSTRVKEMIARVLFDNLQIPSLSFASAPLLALMAAGTVTGLVVDVGNLETTVLPVFHARPLFPSLTTTPRAGSRLNRRLRSLLLAFGSYAPPPSSLNSMTPPAIGRIPKELLTEELIEEIKTRLCFVGEEVPLDASRGEREASAFSGSAMSVDTASARDNFDDPSDPDNALLKELYSRFAATSTAKPVSFRIPNLSQPAIANGTGRGWIQVPGWIRERAAEVLWEEDGDGDERGLAAVVLDCLLKLPLDLRKPMASSILLTGGTAMLPGFFPRFKAALLAQLDRSHPPSPPPSPPLPAASVEPPSSDPAGPMSTDTAASPAPSRSSEVNAKRRRKHALATRLHNLRHSPRYAPLVPLARHLAILNHPSPNSSASSTAPSSTLARQREGSAPSFSPALQSWIGGSLAGALKTGGPEIAREQWDAGLRFAEAEEAEGEEGEEFEEREVIRPALPDWTRIA
ncbi:Fungal specific actin related protein [Rhodotorula toruloides ATCC 204091]|uniref:Actin n=1 Tax=Rhodotorula toruloides TaxID=5286 RepID=A0A0K3CF72_RHOTO|nr:actin [Rhodotorula toruloides]EGU11045.1 Fungal specific actin related protein [Rhodotorula toruloides ATCC 204091]PRQ75892.1 fungal-specific actin related protein [Rhodotorula toruloides]